jgi:uroporphyrin-III C-methyltransferase
LPPDTAAAVIVAATTADERIVVSTLAQVATDAQQHQLGTPSIIVVGNIVKVRQDLLDALVTAESERAR